MTKLSPIDNCVFVTALPRSGTTAFSDTLARAIDAAQVGEVFHDVISDCEHTKLADLELNPEYNFFVFRCNQFGQHPELSLPNKANQEIIFTRYIDYLKQRSSKDCLVIDVKYNSWHHLNPFWLYMDEEPFLLTLIKQRKCPIIHIHRENHLERYISILVAQARRRYHFRKGAQSDPSPVTCHVNVNAALNFVRSSIARVNDMRARLSTYERVLDIDYSRIYFDDRISTLSRDLSNLLKREVHFSGEFQFQKATGSINETVENWEEVARALILNGFSGMVEQAPHGE